jgi:hypothetical protein
MATYKGRDVTILMEVQPEEGKVVIDTEDGMKTVSKGEVTVYDVKEIPERKNTDPNYKAPTEEEKRLAGYRMATPKEKERNTKRQNDKKARDARMLKYRTDGLTPEEIDEEERKFIAAEQAKVAAEQAKKVTL